MAGTLLSENRSFDKNATSRLKNLTLQKILFANKVLLLSLHQEMALAETRHSYKKNKNH